MPCTEISFDPAYRVEKPMQYPDYRIPENYTTDDLRQIAVRAMGDFLNIQWHADKVYEYKNKWDAVDRLFHFEPGVTYAGLPYANAHTGLLQWLCYYDTETGLMSFPADGQTWGLTLGSVCANTILWAWSIMSNSIGGKFHSFTMSPANHFLPVGGYRWPEDIEDFRKYSTKQICEDNGKEAILKAYAQMLPADGLISTPAGHAVMAVTKPEVAYREDGTIDPERSTVVIQDQRPGPYLREGNRQTLHYSGRIGHVYTFEGLYQEWYIPVTTAELAGLKPVSKPEVTLVADTDSVEGLLRGKIVTNYLLCNLEAVLVSPDGSRRRGAIAHFSKADIGLAAAGDGVAYPLEVLDKAGLPEAIRAAAPGTVLRLEARIANGELYTLAQIPCQ